MVIVMVVVMGWKGRVGKVRRKREEKGRNRDRSFIQLDQCFIS